MADDILTLAGDFPQVSHDEWLAAVDRVLRGRSYDAELRSITPDGIVIEPLYTRDDESVVGQVPAAGVSRRASGIVGVTGGWDVRQRVRPTTVDATNAAILADLQRGVTSIELVTSGIDDVATLDAILGDVLLDLAPVSLWSFDDGVGSARLLLDLLERRGLRPGDVAADLGCDPIGRLAARGALARPLPDAMAAAVALAGDVAAAPGGIRAFRADGAPYAAAGATPATELAVVVSTGLSYVRAQVDAGIDAAAAFDNVLLAVSVGTEQFPDIAKIRALRVMWARVAEACGVDACAATVQASSAETVLTARDPWVNILRGTLGCFAAAVGGADIIVIQPFDAALGVPDGLGRRMARNTQLALLEESNLHRVIDPGGGSWFLEALTDELAATAWSAFQQLERGGGVEAALRAGSLQAQIAAAWAGTAGAVAHRRRPITGVSEFPDVHERRLQRAPHPPDPDPGRPAEVVALGSHRLAEGFERLRDAADAAAPPPTVFLAKLGPASEHTARATWAKSFFEAGGIRAAGDDGHDDLDRIAEAFESTGATLAVICGSDSTYAELAAPVATALVDAGAQRVYLAGDPGDRRASYEQAGVREFVHVGTDVLASLRQAHELLGLAAQGPT